MKRRILILLLLLCLMTSLSIGVIADFGDFSGNSDYGGGWSSGDSWSSDYDGGSGVFSMIDAIGVVIFIIIVIVVIIKDKNNKKRDGVLPTSSYTLRPMNEYYTLDPAFNEAAFQEKLSNLYVQMQNCWSAKDISSLRPYFDDAYFMQMDRQLDQYRTQHKTSYIEKIAVLSIDLEGFKQEAGKDHIIATVKTRITQYTLDDRTGKLLSGHRKKEKFMTYEWDLCRTTGYQSAEAAGLDKTICPSCGAPLDINASARCPYCGSVIQSADHDWVLCGIKGISQVTR